VGGRRRKAEGDARRAAEQRQAHDAQCQQHPTEAEKRESARQPPIVELRPQQVGGHRRRQDEAAECQRCRQERRHRRAVF
jgi:hypothetical protein